MSDSKMYLPALLSEAVIEVLKQNHNMMLSSACDYEFKIKVRFDIENNCLKNLRIKKIGFKRA
jgi:hypothetical protein